MGRDGLHAEQITRKDLAEFVPLDQAQKLYDHYERVWQGEETSFAGEWNGHSYRVQMVPIFASDGTVRSGMSVFTETGSFTPNRVTNMSEEVLSRQEKMSIVGQLAAGVAHEMRNPLTSIKGFVQLTKEGNGKTFHYDLILSEIDRMEGIISEFLLLAKPEAEQPSLVNIHDLLLKVITLVNTQAIMSNIVIIDDGITDELPAFRCVENRIKQMFINLFKNAIESMPDGGTIRVVATVDERAHELVVSIADEGCGIPPERLKRLGEPFYSTKEKGTGMGLMLSYKIVEEHRGRIRIESTVDVGTIVYVTFPYSEEYV